MCGNKLPEIFADKVLVYLLITSQAELWYDLSKAPVGSVKSLGLSPTKFPTLDFCPLFELKSVFIASKFGQIQKQCTVYLNVPDLVKPESRCRLSRAHNWPGVLGIWNGEGLGRVEGGEVSSRATWGQGGPDRTTQKEGFQVSKRDWKGNQKGTSKGSKKGGLRHNYIINLYMCI